MDEYTFIYFIAMDSSAYFNHDNERKFGFDFLQLYPLNQD